MAAITFKVSNKEAQSVVAPKPKASGGLHFVEDLPQYRNQGCFDVVQGSPWNPNEFCPNSNGFVNGVVKAYNQHHNLVIRPDDVWLAITTQFGLYVNANAESMRDLFVDHKGKKQLVVTDMGTLRSADYAKLAKAMTGELRKNVKDEKLCSWVLPDFSTTTSNDTVVGSVVLMATLKNYFSYKFCLCCGIPSVTLMGTVDDWEKIHARVDELNKYGETCSNWAGMLKVVTKQLVETSKGNVDGEFWSRICHYHGGGSGPRYISGWVSTFCVFNENGKWQGNVGSGYDFPKVNTNDIPPGYLAVDVVVDDNGIEHETLMFAGHLGWDIVNEGKGIAPKLAWAIAVKDKDKAKAEQEKMGQSRRRRGGSFGL